jgi:hypothetical protein
VTQYLLCLQSSALWLSENNSLVDCLDLNIEKEDQDAIRRGIVEDYKKKNKRKIVCFNIFVQILFYSFFLSRAQLSNYLVSDSSQSLVILSCESLI